MDEVKIKTVIRKRYAEALTRGSGCCNSPTQEESSNCCGETSFNAGSPADSVIESADLGLSCGLPVQDAGIKPGDHVLDLGSGAGVDVFRSAMIVGETGYVTGVDLTPEMVARARANADQGGYQNTAFKLGEIEDLPIPDNSQDVVISNCVINLAPDKRIVFQEIHRVLKSGGHFCISDIVTNGEIPDSIKEDLDAWAACAAGAIDKQAYIHLLEEVGFHDVHIVRSRDFDDVPDEADVWESITVMGYKR